MVVGVIALACAALSTSPAQSPIIKLKKTTLAKLAAASPKNLDSTFVEIAYLGPVSKPLPTVDLATHDPFPGYLQLRASIGDQMPASLAPLTFTVSTADVRAALRAATLFKTSTKNPVVGVYAVQANTGVIATASFDKPAGQRVMRAMIGTVKDPAAKAALQNLDEMMFPH